MFLEKNIQCSKSDEENSRDFCFKPITNL